MKKKILFMVINMNIGGTEKALLNMISEIPVDQYETTLFMLEEYGGFLKYIPDGVRIEYFKKYDQIKDIINDPLHLIALKFFKEGKFVKSLILFFLYLITKLTSNRSIFFKYILKDYPDLKNEYDVAVAYDGPMDFISYFIINKVKANKKIQWIHFDITKIGFNSRFAAKVYNQFNKIFVVSKEAKQKLIHKVPILKDKTEVFSNVVSSSLISAQAKEGEGFHDELHGLRILTVGRLTSEKGQDTAIRVSARLIRQGYKVKWYCVGEGNLRNHYEQLVADLNLQEHFIFLGMDPNPYPYIKQCDIYVQPSRHEGYCIALAEARCLRKPIVTTNFAGALEQIKNGETGFIVQNDEDEIYQAIVKLLNNHDLCYRFSNNLAKEKFDYTLEMEKLYGVF